jgi:hypothetical protein
LSVTQIVQEGIEPLLIGEKLLQKIQYKPGMTTVFPAVEPLRADLAGDGMDLPIYNINIGGAQSFAVQVQRHGVRWTTQSGSSMRRPIRGPGLFVLPASKALARTRTRKDGETEERRSWRRSTTGTGCLRLGRAGFG